MEFAFLRVVSDSQPIFVVANPHRDMFSLLSLLLPLTLCESFCFHMLLHISVDSFGERKDIFWPKAVRGCHAIEIRCTYHPKVSHLVVTAFYYRPPDNGVQELHFGSPVRTVPYVMVGRCGCFALSWGFLLGMSIQS